MTSTRMFVPAAGRQAGLRVGRYPNSIPARSTRLFRQHGIGLVVDVDADVGN